MSKALSTVKRALVRDRIRAALDRVGWSVAEDAAFRESVQTPFEKCRAKDKLSCKYHGAQALFKILSQELPDVGIGTYKTSDGGYAANIDVSAEEAKNAIGKALEGMGYEITNAVDISDGQSQIFIAKKEAPSDEIDNLSPDESMKAGLEELDKFLEDNLTEEDEATLAEMEALLEEDALGTEESEPEAKKKTKKGKASKKVKEALENAGFVADIPDGVLPPLAHDEAKFPQGITQDGLDDAIKHGKKAGGHGGLGTTIVEIGGKKYVCKSGSGKKASIIKNGYNADMAYRAGGVYAPDAQLYDFGDGKTYKLSEFVEGKRLIDVWKNADEAERDKIRSELLKGYPLDVLFSNYDVLGTSPEESQSVTVTGPVGKPMHTSVAFDNVIIGNDGHAYRIDNDGAFAMTGTGGVKHVEPGQFGGKVAYETWDKWQDRQWIDDFRTLRRNPKNAGIFDRYSTADIFLSAGNINMGNAVESLPEPLQKAMAKPLFEMKQMTWRAVNMDLGGFRNNGFMSMALDASYEASKRNLRELCKKNVAWNDAGFGEWKKSWGNYQMKDFSEQPPAEPQDPQKTLKEKLPNDAYTGKKVIGILLGAVKTINHHGGVKQMDSNGNVLGNGTAMSNPDYKPNPSKIAEFEKIDREKLEELAKTDDAAAKCLGIYDTIAYSKANGWKKPIGQIPTDLNISSKLPDGFQGPTEKKLLADMAGAIEQYKKDYDYYTNVALPEYNARKDAHIKAEEARAQKAGGSIYHNFNHFADVLISEGMNTDGISHKVATAGVKPIMDSMSSQKGSSYAHDAVKWKVREIFALGYTASQIRDMIGKDDIYNGNEYTTILDKSADGTSSDWNREMASQAMYCGLQMIKKENEFSDQFDKDSGVVFLNRNINSMPKGMSAADRDLYSDESKTGWVKPHLDSAADCMQFEKNDWGGKYKQVYAVPFSRLVCCANDDQPTGGGFGYNSEQEYVGNLLYMPCFVYHKKQGYTWKGAIDAAKKTSGMKDFLKKMASRLNLFNTLKSK